MDSHTLVWPAAVEVLDSPPLGRLLIARLDIISYHFDSITNQYIMLFIISHHCDYYTSKTFQTLEQTDFVSELDAY